VNDTGALDHDDTADHQRFHLWKHSLHVLWGVDDFDDDREPFGHSLDVCGVYAMVVTKAGYALQKGRTRKPFLAQEFQQPAKEGLVVVRAGFTQDDPEQYLLAFDASHVVPPKDHDRVPILTQFEKV
jgi:hypothetical protein